MPKIKNDILSVEQLKEKVDTVIEEIWDSSIRKDVEIVTYNYAMS